MADFCHVCSPSPSAKAADLSRSIPDGNRIADHAAEPDVSDDELRRMDEAHTAEERARAEARTSGRGFIPRCNCCGGNTPELIGRCPCRGIDLRVREYQS